MQTVCLSLARAPPSLDTLRDEHRRLGGEIDASGTTRPPPG
jgi:hypothetical protein